MIRFVFWTGMISMLAGTALQFPRMASLLMPSERPGMLMNLFGLMAVFLGIMLIFCSRDLNRRVTWFYWKGFFELVGSLSWLATEYGGTLGMSVAVAGLFYLIVGLIYLFGLPKHRGVSFVDLLLDKSV